MSCSRPTFQYTLDFFENRARRRRVFFTFLLKIYAFLSYFDRNISKFSRLRRENFENPSYIISRRNLTGRGGPAAPSRRTGSWEVWGKLAVLRTAIISDGAQGGRPVRPALHQSGK